MFKETLLIGAPKWKQPKYPIVNTVNYVHTTEYHTAMKKNELHSSTYNNTHKSHRQTVEQVKPHTK